MTTAEIIETVKDRLIETYKPKVIYLFGSFCQGQAGRTDYYKNIMKGVYQYGN